MYACMAAVFSEAHVQVHAARIATVDGSIDDLFSLTDRRGRKLTPTGQEYQVGAPVCVKFMAAK